MGTKTKPDATSELHLIMGEVHASVELVVPSNEVREIKMTPAILEQNTAGRGLRCTWIEAQTNNSPRHLITSILA
jgi:hypothetical protein